MFRYIIFLTLTAKLVLASGTKAIKESIKPIEHSEYGIRNLAVQLPTPGSASTNGVFINFRDPENREDKLVSGYSFSLYEFINKSYLNPKPFKDLTYIAKFSAEEQHENQKSHSYSYPIKSLLPNKKYFLVVNVEYYGEEVKSEFSARKHFTYGLDAKGQPTLKSAEKYDFAPSLTATVYEYPNHQEIQVDWATDVDSSDIQYYDLNIVSTDFKYQLFYPMADLSEGSHTFAPAPKGKEYVITMAAVPKSIDYVADYTTSRIFINTNSPSF